MKDKMTNYDTHYTTINSTLEQSLQQWLRAFNKPNVSKEDIPRFGGAIRDTFTVNMLSRSDNCIIHTCY